MVQAKAFTVHTHKVCQKNKLAHEISVLIAYAYSDGSDKPTLSCSLIRALAPSIHKP